MSTFKYDTAAVAFGTKQIDWLNDNIGAMLVGAGYSPSKAHDQYVSDIPAPAIIARSAQMTSMAINNGVFSGIVPEFDALLSSTEAVALILYLNTGTDSTSQLIYYSSDGLGFPFTPSGINYFVTFDQANGGWFQ